MSTFIPLTADDVNYQDPSERMMNGLMLAVEMDRYDMAKLIAEDHRSDLELKNNAGETALHIAIRRGNFRMQRMLVGEGANIHARIGENGPTAISYAMSLLGEAGEEGEEEIVIR